MIMNPLLGPRRERERFVRRPHASEEETILPGRQVDATKASGHTLGPFVSESAGAGNQNVPHVASCTSCIVICTALALS